MLVAEDEPLVLDLVHRLLRRSGYHVLRATDGADAVRRFRERAGAVEMRLSGTDVLDEIRKLDPNIPVLLMSGYDDASTNAAMARHGQVRFLAKPFEPAALIYVVAEMLGARRG